MSKAAIDFWLWGLVAVAVLLSGAVRAQTCRERQFDGVQFSTCVFDMPQTDLRLWLRDDEGQIYGSFDALNDGLAKGKRALLVGMNAGMYHPDRRPVGLYIENGQEVTPLVTRAGPGNFGLLPNGVLCIAPDGARVIESLKFASERPNCAYATQSGPMLVIDGELHPRFLVNGTSKKIRNGVGVDESKALLFLVISDQPVNFHHFARFFRDSLQADQALFLDGRISKLYAPELDRHDSGWPMGPILGITRAAQ